MKKNIIILMLLAATAARAFDFSAVTQAGQTVYYTITSGTTVMVVNPDWDSHMQPSGFLALPSHVTNSGTTYQVTAIDVQAFMNCESLTGVSMPEGVTSIGRLAFAYCTSLDSIVLPSTLMEIGTMAFTGTAYYSDNTHINEQGLMIINSYVIAARRSINEAIEVPESTLGLGNMAFYSCDQMPKITLPATVRFIGENAFSSCQELDTVVMRPRVPPTLESNSFLDMPPFTVVVPCGTLGIYSTAENWSTLTVIQKCSKPAIDPLHPFNPILVGIDDAEVSPLAAVSVEGGLFITMPDGYTCTVRDVLGRIVSTLRNPGFVPLQTAGLYLVSSPQMEKTIKVIFNN